MKQLILSVIVPVFNEARSIGQLLEAVRGSGVNQQVIIVDDGSTDGSKDIIREFATAHDWLFIEHPQNYGKGAAIRSALEHVTGDLLIIQDGDLEYNPQDYHKLMQPIVSGEADVVLGSRRLGGGATWRRLLTPFYHGVTILNMLVKILYGKKVTDEASGYKMFKAADIRRMALDCQRFEFCPEVVAKACRMGLDIVEMPISYHPRSIAEGKKIAFRDAITAVATLWKYRRWSPDQSIVEIKTSEPKSAANADE